MTSWNVDVHMRIHIHMYVQAYVCAGWQRDGGCLIFIGLFPRKSPIIIGTFAKRDLNVTARHPMHLRHPVRMSRTPKEDPYDAFSCRSFSAKEPPIIGLFCKKWPIKTKHPMTLRHVCCCCQNKTHCNQAQYVYSTRECVVHLYNDMFLERPKQNTYTNHLAPSKNKIYFCLKECVVLQNYMRQHKSACSLKKRGPKTCTNHLAPSIEFCWGLLRRALRPSAHSASAICAWMRSVFFFVGVREK